MSVYPPLNLLPTRLEAPRLGVPSEYLRRMLSHIAQLPNIFANADEKRQTLFFSAVCDLAGTCNAEEGQALFESYSGEVAAGDPADPRFVREVRRLTLSLHGLARDRQLHGPAARSLDVWLVAADEALATYQRQPLPAAV